MNVFQQGSISQLASRSTKSRLVHLGSPTLLEAGSSAVEVDVILIPGYGTPPPEQWKPIPEWSRDLLGISRSIRVHIHAFKFDTSPGNRFELRLITEKASDLLDLLKWQAERVQDNRRLFFVCHSLGGVILKHALHIAHRYQQQFHNIINLVAGIVFLGTPNAGPDPKSTWERHMTIYKTLTALHLEQPIQPHVDHVSHLSNLPTLFRQVELSCPILSVYEAMVTKLRRRHWFKPIREKLVDMKFAQTLISTEVLLEAQLNHVDLCKLSCVKNSTLSVMSFIRNVLADIESLPILVTPPIAIPRATFPLPSIDINAGPFLQLTPSISTTGSTRSNLVVHGIKFTAPNRGLATPPSIPLSPSRNPIPNKNRPLCFMLQGRVSNPDFYGREEELRKIDDFLLPNNKRHTPSIGPEHDDAVPIHFSLSGMGGIGKTELAVQFACTRRSQFQAVFWLDAAAPSKLASDFGAIAMALGLEDTQSPKDLEASRDIAMSWLTNSGQTGDDSSSSTLKSAPWLIIFDNADDLKLISDYWPRRGYGAILVTSRDSNVADYFSSNGSGISLDPFSLDDAAQFLRKLIKGKPTIDNPDETDASLAMAKQLGGLPLALFQMAGVTRHKSLSIREFVELYPSGSQYAEIHDLSTDKQHYRYGHTLATTFDISIKSLTPNSHALLKIMSFLNPDRIQEFIFERQLSKGSARLPFLKSASAFTDARSDLIKWSMIKRNIDSKELWLHRVLEKEIRVMMFSENERYATFKEALMLVEAVWPKGDMDTRRHHCKRWVKCEELLPHLERLYQLYNEFEDKWKQFDIIAEAPTLFHEAGVYLHERGFSHYAKPYLELSLKICEKANIQVQPLLSDIYYSLGAIGNTSDVGADCFRYNRILLDMRKQIALENGGPDIRLAYANSQLGVAHMVKKEYEKATTLFETSIDTLTSLNVDLDDFGFVRANLGLALWMQRRHDDAHVVFTKALEERKAKFGEMDKVSYKTGRILHGLGNVESSLAKKLRRSGCHEEGLALYQKSMKTHQDAKTQFESVLGKRHHRVADIWHKLAEHQIRLGKDEEAIEYLNHALSIWDNRPVYKSQIARTTFLRGTHLKMMDAENSAVWQADIEKAITLRREILEHDTKPEEELTTDDFDELVLFWSR